jgi:hypothetical protein
MQVEAGGDDIAVAMFEAMHLNAEPSCYIVFKRDQNVVIHWSLNTLWLRVPVTILGLAVSPDD